MDTLKLKKAWEVALAPVKSLPMTAFMMYMSGNSLQIFSIMMVVMAFKNPLMGLVNTNQAFERFQTDSIAGQLIQVKLVYIACQIVALAVGVWKINSMGLLPFVPPFLGRALIPFANKRMQDNEVGLADVGGTEGIAGSGHHDIVNQLIDESSIYSAAVPIYCSSDWELLFFCAF
jgi:hypothetical protein